MSNSKEHEVRVETLAPAKAARFHAFSKSPEPEAWEKAKAWAGQKGLLGEDAEGRVFGRNNPPPRPGEEEYGYEFFIELQPGVEDISVEMADIEGGLCAVLTCRGVESLPDAWRRLYQWVEDSQYQVADHGLEHHLNPSETDLSNLLFKLWLPVEP